MAIGKKVVHHLMMTPQDTRYIDGLVPGARLVEQWGDVGTELMVYADGDIALFLGYEEVRFLAPVYEGDFMEFSGEITDIGNQSYQIKFEAYKVATLMINTGVDMTEMERTAATACEPPVLCGSAVGTMFISKADQRGPQEVSFMDRKHRGE